jgi:hypothetical protein
MTVFARNTAVPYPYDSCGYDSWSIFSVAAAVAAAARLAAATVDYSQCSTKLGNF